MSTLLTKRRAVDLCRVAACLCFPALTAGHLRVLNQRPVAGNAPPECGRPGDGFGPSPLIRPGYPYGRTPVHEIDRRGDPSDSSFEGAHKQ